MRENFMSGIDEGRQDKPGEACFLLYPTLRTLLLINLYRRNSE
jgi:hypothetical protein